jgi:predicted nucleic acid-binding protein
MPDSPVCVDASLVVRLVLSAAPEGPVARLWQGWYEAGRPVVAPALLYYEVSNALHRYVVLGELLPEEAADALDAALAIEITLYSARDLHRRALQLAASLELPAAYDAHYLALAERLGADFWTADHRLVRAVQDALPWVHALQTSE